MKQKFVPYEKLSKKEQKKLNARKRADSFGVKMVSKVEPDRKKFQRHPKHKPSKSLLGGVKNYVDN